MRKINAWTRAGCGGALAILLIAVLANSLYAQQYGEGKWADKDDPVAKYLIEEERKWSTLSCEPSNVLTEFIAPDFVGTAPEGPLYGRAKLIEDAKAPSTDHDCKLLAARVRFYGPNLAILYGKDSVTTRGPDGKEFTRVLIWTDTAIKRDGKWQDIETQDMVDPKK